MLRSSLIKTSRRFGTTIQSGPRDAAAAEQTWVPRSLWEILFIVGTGTFGVYEIYKGMFLLPQSEPRVEIYTERFERKPGNVEEVERERVVAADKPPIHVEASVQPKRT
jgi:hypothetical protein